MDIVIKLITSISIILSLLILMQHVSLKTVATISSLPTGTAIIYFYFSLDHSTSYAKDSSVYSLVGFFALFMFLGSFAYLSRLKLTSNKIFNILIIFLISFVFCIITAYILHEFKFNIITSNIAAIFSIVIFHNLYKLIPTKTITSQRKLTIYQLIFRSIFSGVLILGITLLSFIVNAKYAGLLTSFPSTLAPFLIIVLYQDSCDHVINIVKGIPIGMFSVICYVDSVYIFYPKFGTYVGTLFSYLVVCFYLLIRYKAKNIYSKIKL